MLHWVWPHCEFIQTKFYIFFSDLSNIIENVITLKSSLHKLLVQEVREEGLAGPESIPTSLWIEPPVPWSAISLSRSRTDVLHQLGKCPDSMGKTRERDSSLGHKRQLQLQACFGLYIKYPSMHVFEPQWVELFWKTVELSEGRGFLEEVHHLEVYTPARSVSSP